jgi:hypothetical protein
MTQQFYTYVYKDPKTNLPIYIGKGCEDRAWKHKWGKHHLANVNKKRSKEGFSMEPMIYKQDSEQGAFDLEMHLINIIGRKDLGKGPLLNKTDGGEGIAGYKHTDTAEALADRTLKWKAAMREKKSKDK